MTEIPDFTSITIVGAGSWATALCKIFSDTGFRVHWWFHRPDDVNYFTQYRHNPKYLTDVDFGGKPIEAHQSLNEALQRSDLVLIGVPSAFVESVFEQADPLLMKEKWIISSIKGILPSHLQLVTDYLASRFKIPTSRMAVIGGPCHAEEVALEKQSYLTVAAADSEFANQLKSLMQSRFISVTTSADMDGMEWAAVLKNVYAIACGVCHGLGFGDNFQAVLVANAMQEMTLFLDYQAPTDRNAFASAYLGDLLVTAYSTFSRNRTFGNMIGRGYSVTAAKVELGMVAEGYYAVNGLQHLREKHNIRLPIAEAIYSILYLNSPARETIGELRKILK